MPLKKLSEDEMKEKLYRREEIRKIVAERGLTNILKIDPEFMKQAEGQVLDDEPRPDQGSKWKRGANIAMDRFLQVTGAISGASYLGSNVANVAGAPNLAQGYFTGGLVGFMNSVPNVVKQGKNLTENWKESSNYERYKGVKRVIGGMSGLAGNTRNMVVQAADGIAGVPLNSPGLSHSASGVNPAQLEAGIAFNIINNVLVVLDGVDQIYESRSRKKEIKNTSAELRTQVEGKIEGINSDLDDDRIGEILSSLKDPKVKSGRFIPALTKMLGIVEEAHKSAVHRGETEENLEKLETVKAFLKDNMASFEETEKLVRTNAMAMRQANFETACGAYDLVKGSVSVAAVSASFVSSPMGGIAGLVDGLVGVVGAAALKGKFFGFEELWDNKSIIGQRNRRKAAAKEVDAVICLCGDRDYDMKSATQQLVEDVIKDYNERNPEDSLPIKNDTKRSFASKVYYELGSVERSKAGLGNNIMLIRAAELRTAALQEATENGPYHWCIKSLGLRCTDKELPAVDQIAMRIGCNRNWRDLVKNEEIDKKEKKWSDRQLQGAEGADADGSARSRQAREQVEWGLGNTTEKRKEGRNLFTKRVTLETIQESEREELSSPDVPIHQPKKVSASMSPPSGTGREGRGARLLRKEELSEMGIGMGDRSKDIGLRLPEVPAHEPGAEAELSAGSFKRDGFARQPVRMKQRDTGSEGKGARLLRKEELSEMGIGVGGRSKDIVPNLPEVPTHEPGAEAELSASPLKRGDIVRQPVRKKQRNTRL